MDCGIPFCHNGCPLGQPDPRLERPRLPRPLARRDRAAARHQQLPGVHRPALPGAVRGARACSASTSDPVTIKQVEVEIVDRAWDEGWVDAAAADRRDRQDASRSSARARPAWPPRSSSPAPATTVTVFERADRIGGLLRYGIPEFKMEKRHLDRRLDADGGRGHRVPRRRRTSASTSPATQLRARVRRGRARRRRDRVRATCRCPGRELDGIHLAMEYLPLAEPACSRATSTTPPITAEGKHVVIIGGGDTGADCLGTAHRQGAASVHQFEILPRPPETRAPSQPVADVADDLPGLVARTRRAASGVYAVNTERFVGDDDGNVRALRARTRCEMVDGRLRRRSRAPSFELAVRARAAGDGLRRPRARPACSSSSASSSTQRGNVAPRRRLHDQRAGRVRRRRHGPRAVADRLGDRRGPLVRGRRRPLPDGRSVLPAPIAPDRTTARRLSGRGPSPRQPSADS